MTTVAPAPEVNRAPRTGRLVGVDVARFLAIYGMFCIHFGVPFITGWLHDRISEFSNGRSTALFTLLAGVSLALMTGRQEPPEGPLLRDARQRVAIRAGLMLVLGWVLVKATASAGFLLTIIIPFYGLYFLLCLPFLRLRARGLVIAAVVATLVGPQLSFVVRGWVYSDTPLATVVSVVNSIDPAHLITNEGFFDLLLLGYYPAMSYLALVLGGMAVGRMDLRSTRVRLRIGGVGLALSLIGQWVPVLLGVVAPPGPNDGTVEIHHPQWLLDGGPHSGTSFELIGSGGVALVCLVLCLELADRAGKWITPLANAGSMGLTLYALHAPVLAWQVVVGGWHLSGKPDFLTALATAGPNMPNMPDLPAFPRDGHTPSGFVWWLNTYMPEIVLVVALIFANLWRHYFRRGPLEALISDAVAKCMTYRRTRGLS